ncbi:hypothetical protein JCM3766R1_000903 [Sporobolomyces carnicolor]
MSSHITSSELESLDLEPSLAPVDDSESSSSPSGSSTKRVAFSSLAVLIQVADRGEIEPLMQEQFKKKAKKQISLQSYSVEAPNLSHATSRAWNAVRQALEQALAAQGGAQSSIVSTSCPTTAVTAIGGNCRERSPERRYKCPQLGPGRRRRTSTTRDWQDDEREDDDDDDDDSSGDDNKQDSRAYSPNKGTPPSLTLKIPTLKRRCSRPTGGVATVNSRSCLRSPTTTTSPPATVVATSNSLPRRVPISKDSFDDDDVDASRSTTLENSDHWSPSSVASTSPRKVLPALTGRSPPTSTMSPVHAAASPRKPKRKGSLISGAPSHAPRHDDDGRVRVVGAATLVPVVDCCRECNVATEYGCVATDQEYVEKWTRGAKRLKREQEQERERRERLLESAIGGANADGIRTTATKTPTRKVVGGVQPNKCLGGQDDEWEFVSVGDEEEERNPLGQKAKGVDELELSHRRRHVGTLSSMDEACDRRPPRPDSDFESDRQQRLEQQQEDPVLTAPRSSDQAHEDCDNVVVRPCAAGMRQDSLSRRDADSSTTTRTRLSHDLDVVEPSLALPVSPRSSQEQAPTTTTTTRITDQSSSPASLSSPGSKRRETPPHEEGEPERERRPRLQLLGKRRSSSITQRVASAFGSFSGAPTAMK